MAFSHDASLPEGEGGDRTEIIGALDLATVEELADAMSRRADVVLICLDRQAKTEHAYTVQYRGGRMGALGLAVYAQERLRSFDG